MDIPCIYSSKPPRHPQNIVLNIFPVHQASLLLLLLLSSLILLLILFLLLLYYIIVITNNNVVGIIIIADVAGSTTPQRQNGVLLEWRGLEVPLPVAGH